MKSIIIALLLIICLVNSTYGFTTTNNQKINSIKQKTTNKRILNASLKQQSFANIIAKATLTNGSKTAALAITTVSTKDIIAKALGYVLGFGALAVYLPIIINLIKAKSADGYSVETWIFNLIGLTIACLYPFKKGFGVSTYVEILAIAIQSAGILGLICFYQQKLKEYLIGMVAFVASCTFICVNKVPNNVLNWMQVAAIIVCNYANIPQIVLTFQTKKATWSWITSAMSMAGNLIRVFTTIQLTKDTLVLSGNTLGFLTNLILFLQVFIYKKK